MRQFLSNSHGLRTRCQIAALLLLSSGPFAPAAEPESQSRANTRFSAQEANQGVAVDDKHFYAVTNAAIGKYDKQSSERVAQWPAPQADAATKEPPLKHLNGGMIFDGRLYCAHSNWPSVPTINTLEIWDAATLKRAEPRTLDGSDGALNWVDRHDGHWWAVFAHYSHAVDASAADHVSHTRLVKFDDGWQPLQSWVFPEEVWRRFAPSSNSGGSFGPDGLLYCTGHDRAELYALRVPAKGTTLEYVRTVAAPIAGQGIAWDRSVEPQRLYGIIRAKRQVVVMELPDAKPRP